MTATLGQASSELVTDFKGCCKRRFVVIDVPDLGPVRLRSLSAKEVETIRKYHSRPYAQYAAAIALFVVNDLGERVHVVDDETINGLMEMDSKIFEVLRDAVEQFCFAQISLADLVKNSE